MCRLSDLSDLCWIIVDRTLVFVIEIFVQSSLRPNKLKPTNGAADVDGSRSMFMLPAEYEEKQYFQRYSCNSRSLITTESTNTAWIPISRVMLP